MTTARIITRPFGPGPGILCLLDAAAPMAEVAVLHSADLRGHSVLALNPIRTITIDETSIAHWPGANPLAALQLQLDHITFLSDTPIPLVGWIGGISYDVGRHLETIPSAATDDMGWPIARFALYRYYFVLDHATNDWTLATLQLEHETAEETEQQLAQMARFIGAASLVASDNSGLRTQDSELRTSPLTASPRPAPSHRPPSGRGR